MGATVISLAEQIVRIVSYHSARPHPPRVICETSHRLPPHPVHTVSDTLRQSRCSRNTALFPNSCRIETRNWPNGFRRPPPTAVDCCATPGADEVTGSPDWEGEKAYCEPCGQEHP